MIDFVVCIGFFEGLLDDVFGCVVVFSLGVGGLVVVVV